MALPLPLCRSCGAELQPEAEACFCCGATAPRTAPTRREPSVLLALGAFWQLVGLVATLYGGYRILRLVFSVEVVDRGELESFLYVFGSGVAAIAVGCFLFLVHRQRRLAAPGGTR